MDCRLAPVNHVNSFAHLRGWSPFVGQIEYSLIERSVERELVPMAKALNIGVTACSPLAGGVLTGKYHGHGSPEQARMNSDMLKDFMPEQKRAERIVAAVKSCPTTQAKAQHDLPKDSDAAALSRFVAAVVYGMAVLASGGASRKELEQVIRTAMKAWPATAQDSEEG